jgi:hypothetical protein
LIVSRSHRTRPSSPLFSRFTLSAHVFYTGALCGIVDYDNRQGIGMLHVLQRGRLKELGLDRADYGTHSMRRTHRAIVLRGAEDLAECCPTRDSPSCRALP